MSDPPSPQYSWRQFFEDFANVAGVVSAVVALLSGVLWLLGVFPLIAGAIFFFALGSSLVAFIGHRAVSSRQPILGLGDFRPEVSAPKPLPPKPRPQSNLQLMGIEYMNLWADDDEVYWEIRQDNCRQEYPNYSALLRFSNEPVPGHPGQPIRNLRAKLVFRDKDTGQQFPIINRGAWVGQKYNAIDLEVGDSRLLLIGFGLPFGKPNPGWVFVMASNHSKEHYGPCVLHKIDSRRLEVVVRLVAGDGGYVLFEEPFELTTSPRILLMRSTNLAPE